MKRVLDIIVAAAGLVLLAPAMLCLAGAVRWTSPGPTLFRQWRVGREAKLFHCLKLRTMRHGTLSVPTHEAPPSEVTPLGMWLRGRKLDELPQLWNVLRGEMSLVGPRPSLPGQALLIAERKRLGVMALRPGITGLAQVRGIDMSDPARLAAVDAEYLSRATLRLDLAILARTLLGGATP